MEPQLVGRRRERAVLATAVEDALDGRGRVVLLSGEAGIGKSRLGAHAVDLARDRGFTVLTGQADPLQTGLAYAPIVAAVRRVLNTVDDVEAAELAGDLPDLGRLVADPRLPAPGTAGDPDLDRTRMFEAVLRLAERLARRAPTLLFLDDLHWADRGTIELANYLGQGCGGHRLLVLCTHRPAEPGSALADLAATVRRQSGDDLALAPLTSTDVAELVGQLLGEQPSDGFLHDVTARTRGNPLFITTLVTRDERPVPGIIRDVVLEKLRELDATQRELLDLIAVAGEAGSLSLLNVAWHGGDLDETLTPLLRRGLVEEGSAGATTYRVSHPLFAEVAYAELTASGRRRLHATVAAAMDEVDPGNVLALAPHYRGAGDRVSPNRAVEVLAAAGRRALGVFAAEEAVEYLTAALALARPVAPELVTALLDDLGLAHQGAGNLDAAAAVWSQRLDLAEQLGEDELRAALHLRLALLESERGNRALADSHAQARLQLTGALDTQSIMLRWVIASRHWDNLRLRGLTDWMAGLDLDHADPGVRAVVAQSRAYAAILDCEFTTAHRLLLDGLHAVEPYADEQPGVVHAAHRLLAAVCLLLGDIPAAIAHTENGVNAKAVIQVPAARCSTQFMHAAARYYAGEPREALAMVENGIASCHRIGLHRLGARMVTFRALLLAELGRSEEATECLRQTEDRRDLRENGFLQGWNAAATAVALHSGHPADAPPLTDPVPFRDVIGCLGVHLAGLAAIAAGNDAAAAGVAEILRRTGRTSPLLHALADQQDGLIAAARGDNDGSRELLTTAAKRLDAMGAILLSAQAWVAALELDDDADPDLIEACLSAFEHAGSTPWLARARRLTRAHGLTRRTKRGSGVLSERETEVVHLVGAGLSNADIAKRLFLSERTVETHLRNSYRKLDIDSRLALAQWANAARSE
ncbi:ATP-binding protein [Amycolatopsis anabasis]|uniref:ATP-binding protein n=1 Tax=Amycolatopsis anabasis TaxID=1840409 RepID=UPI00131CA191|nr:AAA family ATPase [Amycolatopsis anabasis]